METLNEIFDTNGLNGFVIAVVCLMAVVIVILGGWVTWRDRKGK